LDNIKILKIEDEKNGIYRVVLETPKGVARMWITDDDYKNGTLTDISSNASSYLVKFKTEIEMELKKYKLK
jgi:hypothetical protein